MALAPPGPSGVPVGMASVAAAPALVQGSGDTAWLGRRGDLCRPQGGTSRRTENRREGFAGGNASVEVSNLPASPPCACGQEPSCSDAGSPRRLTFSPELLSVFRTAARLFSSDKHMHTPLGAGEVPANGRGMEKVRPAKPRAVAAHLPAGHLLGRAGPSGLNVSGAFGRFCSDWAALAAARWSRVLGRCPPSG